MLTMGAVGQEVVVVDGSRWGGRIVGFQSRIDLHQWLLGSFPWHSGWLRIVSRRSSLMCLEVFHQRPDLLVCVSRHGIIDLRECRPQRT